MSLLTVAPRTERWPSAQNPRRILIAEDDEEMRSLLAAVLEQDGYLVDEVGDGTALLERFVRWEDEDEEDGPRLDRPALVITDVQMPGLSGLGAVSQLRKWNQEIAVIVITAFGDARTHRKARELGVAAVLDKPFDLLDFRGAVESAVECSDLRDDVA